MSKKTYIVGDDGDKEWLCEHKVGHGKNVHTCDGCCSIEVEVHKWLRSKLIPTLRKLFLWSKLRRTALKTAEINKQYKCNKCKKLFTKDKVTVDHIYPIIDRNEGFPQITMLANDSVIPEGTKANDWTRYVYRLFCGLDNLQVLCYNCHKIKTKKELNNAKDRKTKRSS